jgi:hypothetical protein
MSVSLTLHQVTQVIPPTPPCTAPVYRVTAAITAATNIDPAVFVFGTATQAFDHYGTVADLERWANSLAQASANGDAFYRLAAVTRDWPTIRLMTKDLEVARSRLQFLVDEMNAAQLGVIVDTTTTLSSS